MYRIVSLLFDILIFLVFARALMSWLPISRNNRLIDLLYQVTEPILAPIRTLIERSSFGRNMMVDFSSLIAMILLIFIRNLILNLIR